MKPTVTYPDPERETVDILTDLFEDAGENAVTVGVGVPDGWTPGDNPHLGVACDGTFTDLHPIIARSTIRLVARAATTTEAKRLAQLAHGLLCGWRGDAGVSAFQPLTGLLPARDPKTDAEIAAVTVRALLRSTPVPV
jgi:hypothetical protein